MKIILNIMPECLTPEWRPIGDAGLRFKEMPDGSFDLYLTHDLKRTLARAEPPQPDPDLDGRMPTI